MFMLRLEGLMNQHLGMWTETESRAMSTKGSAAATENRQHLVHYVIGTSAHEAGVICEEQ